jgi:hypothetical protein
MSASISAPVSVLRSVRPAAAEITPQAMVEFLNMPEYSHEVVAEALVELRAAGDYDRIVSDPFSTWNG